MENPKFPFDPDPFAPGATVGPPGGGPPNGVPPGLQDKIPDEPTDDQLNEMYRGGSRPANHTEGLRNVFNWGWAAAKQPGGG